MSKAILPIAEAAAGIGLAIAGGMTGNVYLLDVGVGMAIGGIAGTIAALTAPGTPISVGNTGLLPVQQPNALWRIQYGVFQAAAALESFIDGPNLLWAGTGDDSQCNNQFLNLVHTLTCHQIAAFLSVTIDGETFNFGTDIILQTAANASYPLGDQNENLWLPGFWGFSDRNNPYFGYVFFHFDAGDPGFTGQPFPLLVAGATVPNGPNTIPTGSPKWTASCLQRGRAKVRIFIDYRPEKNSVTTFNGAGYPIANGRIPKFEFKCAGRIIQDPRVQTAWQPNTTYARYQYVLVTVNGVTNIWVQQIVTGVSGATMPPFAANMAPPINGSTGITLSDGTCSWLNCGVPIVTAGNGQTSLNNPGSIKLGGPGGSMLIADAWQGGTLYQPGAVIEAPIGYYQQYSGGITLANRPLFSGVLGSQISDGAGTWTCLGRSQYATMLPDDDGTQNTGGISNPALCLFDYLTTPRGSFGLGVTPDLSLIDSVIAAANICDEPVLVMVPLVNGPGVYERQYSCNGIFDTSQKYGDVLRALALSMAGWVTPPGPSWQIYAGAYVAPTISLGDDDLRGVVKGDFRLSARSICNGVKGTFIPSWLPINPNGPTVNAPAAPNWRETDFPPYQDAAAVAQDGGIPIWKDIKLDFTTSLWTAQRIAKIVCEQLRRQQTISPQFKIYALQLVAGDVMEFTHARWGLEAATYQVQSMVLTADAGDDKVPALGVDQVLRQTDAGVYTFNPPTSPTNYGDYSPYGSTGVGAGDVA